MRKAFDANVPKLKPRLKAQVSAGDKPPPYGLEGEAEAALSISTPTGDVHPLSPAGGEGKGEGARSRSSAPHADPLPARLQEEEVAGSPAPGPLFDVEARRERLEKIKRKVAEAARTGARIDPVPAQPARAAESVLGLARDLEAQLGRARDLEEALRGDLAQAKEDLGRAVAEGRTAAQRLAQVESQLEEKRQVLEEMLGEMGALEEERDQAVRRAQALAALDEERQKLLDEVGRRSEETEKALAESRAEGERLSSELDGRTAENARLRAGLAEATRERDVLAREAERSACEREELLEAKRALEQVHQALSQARARLG